MKLRVKHLKTETGGPLVAIINEKDAEVLDLHAADRIKIFYNGQIETAVIDITESLIPKGFIGVYDEVLASLKLKNKDVVRIRLAKKPLSIDYIKKKLDGEHLTKKEIDQLVWDIVHNKLSQVELTFFVAGSYCNPNTLEETLLLTKAMVKEGDRLHIDSKIVIDKHSIGGIPGNRTTMILVPIMAAAGYVMPKTSSRAITSPAGTADTMEVLADVVFPLPKMKKIIKKAKGCIVWGGALRLAPADDKIISVEKPLMIDAESQLLASILAKKNSVSSSHVIIDIPIGPNTKITNTKKASHLKRKFLQIGTRLGMKIKVVLTDGRQPIGNGLGPALEARDVLKVLKQRPDRPLDLERKCITMAADFFKLIGRKNGRALAKQILSSGKAYEKMKEIIKLQGGNPNIKTEEIPLAPFEYDVIAQKSGRIRAIDNLLIAKLARIAGAPQTKGAGIYLYKHIGDTVRKGKRLFTVYAGSKSKIDYVKQVVDEMDIIDY
ncbi:AMP phosphorylase [Candidatus Woesearchaeota archaeon]|nr:AMP phosphorylase [Candidatus Woesearchaeota archaeon]